MIGRTGVAVGRKCLSARKCSIFLIPIISNKEIEHCRAHEWVDCVRISFSSYLLGAQGAGSPRTTSLSSRAINLCLPSRTKLWRVIIDHGCRQDLIATRRGPRASVARSRLVCHAHMTSRNLSCRPLSPEVAGAFCECYSNSQAAFPGPLSFGTV